MGKQPLVLGHMLDVLSGKTIEDTRDNRYRQKLAMPLLDAGHKPKRVDTNSE